MRVRTVIDIDDEALRLAGEELGTTSKVATVNAACAGLPSSAPPAR
jgi:Arc/MetJ family transcription regulator